jgi:hypothetical protein
MGNWPYGKYATDIYMGRKLVMRSFFLATFAVFLLTVCSTHDCNKGTFPGIYVLSKHGETHRLRLQVDGTAQFEEAGKSTVTFQWLAVRGSSNNDYQLELRVSSDTSKSLANLSNKDWYPTQANNLFFVLCECSMDGQLRRLILDPDLDLAFVRIND